MRSPEGRASFGFGVLPVQKTASVPLPPNFEVSQVLLLRGAELELEAFPSRCARFEVMGR